MLESGYIVHAYTSPHLEKINERFFISNKFISDKLLSQQLPLNTQYNYKPIVNNPAFSGNSESSSIILIRCLRIKFIVENI